MTKNDEEPGVAAAAARVLELRRRVAQTQAELAAAAVAYADVRTQQDRTEGGGRQSGAGRVRPGEFATDELSVLLREQPWSMRCLVARSRRIAADLPAVWAAFAVGDVDADQVRAIDKVARRVAEASTLLAIDQSVVEAAQTRSPKQLAAWLLRLVVRCEPLAFERRHRRALAERRVTVNQGPDGIGFVTGEVSADDAAAIDARLAVAARGLGADDPRSQEQRRSDVFADLLLGRLRLLDDDPGAEGSSESRSVAADPSWLEVERVDPDTGELLSPEWQQVDAQGVALGGPVEHPPTALLRGVRRSGGPLRIGLVVPLTSLLDLDDTPGELADRSAVVPAEEIRQLIAGVIGPSGSRHDEVLFTRLLTDTGGRLLDTTELGRFASRRLAEAVSIRAGTCRFPTCTVAAHWCDLDHHEPSPRGPTSGRNLDPGCRHHHRAKTHAWLATVREDDGVSWTLPDATRYRCLDEPLLTGAAVAA